jgi:DnaJ-class molecular chaperone
MAWGKKDDKDKKPNPAQSPGRGGRQPRRCGTCGGRGTVTAWTVDRKGKRISYEKRCDNCGGRGETK